jgi:hypothetical protein
VNDKERAYAYCANEMWSGYPCGVDGCPHCGGDVEKTREWVAEKMKGGNRESLPDPRKPR